MSDEPIIELRGVWKLFGDDVEAALSAIRAEGLAKREVLERFNCVVGVADVNFDVYRGEIFCVMGLSGSGKSTLVRHINRLLEPTAGEIRVSGRDILELDTDDLRQYRNEHIAMVFQNFALMPHRSVLDNIALPLEIRGLSKKQRLRIANEALEMVELGDWGNKFAHELSGGMQQRVGLARAIAADVDILLMDEPFSALDPLIRRQLQDEFLQLSKMMKKTTVFITHDLDEAVRIGDRIAIMHDGLVVQIGTPEEIIMNPADDYVAAFVADISRAKVVRARALMRPIEDFESDHGTVSSDALTFAEDTHVTELARATMDSDLPMVIVDKDGARIGVVTRTDLLAIAIEGADPAPRFDAQTAVAP